MKTCNVPAVLTFPFPAPMVAFLTMVIFSGCTSVKDYTVAAVKIGEIKATSLTFIVQRQRGRVISKLTQHLPTHDLQEVNVYRVTYDLTATSPLKPRLEFLYREPVPEEPIDYGGDWYRDRLGLSEVSLVFSRNPALTRAFQALTQKEKKTLRRLNIDADRVDFKAKVNNQTAYLALRLPGPRMQVAIPASRFVATLNQPASFVSIWDLQRARLCIVGDEPDVSDIVGLPAVVTVWEYEKGKATKYELAPVHKRDLDHVQPVPMVTPKPIDPPKL